MPQLAIIQPTSPKAPPQTKKAGAASDHEQSAFSPLLDKAASRNKKTQADDGLPNVRTKNNIGRSAEGNNPLHQAVEPKKTEDIPDLANPSEVPTLSNANNVLLAMGTVASEKTTPTTNIALITKQNIQPTPLSVDGVTPEKITPTTDIALLMDQNIQPDLSLVEGVTPKKITPMINSASPVSQQINPDEQQLQNMATDEQGKITAPEAGSAEVEEKNIEIGNINGNKPTPLKTSNTLLDQLQRIIDQSDETGTVSITRAARPAPGNGLNSMRSTLHGIVVPIPAENQAKIIAASLIETSAVPASGLAVVTTLGEGNAITRPSQQVSADNHDARHHYFNPKIAAVESGDGRQNSQGNQQGDQLGQQASSSGAQNSPASGLSSGAEPGSTFAQVVSATPQPTSQGIDAAERPLLHLPSGLIVQEDDIIQQLSQKMQLSGKNMDTRINLRLHPAELGSLKIDLTVKEGSIRANVIAQSQHTSELLEKNMAKLKTVLENQGYSVDEIVITTESESVSDFNLFDQQLFDHNDYHPKPQNPSKETTETVFTLPDAVFAAPATSPGVNVKI